MELYIVLAIMAFMIFGFILNKWPFGVTTMVCCVLLALSGVFTIPQAFSGLSNKKMCIRDRFGGFVYQVVFVGGKVVEIGLHLDAGLFLPYDVHPVEDPNGLHDHADLVVAVLPPAQNVQA